MDGDLTLKINESVLKEAFRYAQENKMDLSVMVEDFLTKFTDDSKKRQIVVSDEVKELIGILPLEEISWKEQKASGLVEKYK